MALVEVTFKFNSGNDVLFGSYLKELRQARRFIEMLEITTEKYGNMDTEAMLRYAESWKVRVENQIGNYVKNNMDYDSLL